jgi:paraquat-inducible protein A
MLYLPANILPIMITDLLGDKMPSTIMAGVILLWSEGSYPVALVIFIASIMVPTLENDRHCLAVLERQRHGNATANACI